jgi:hypothetical protein
MALLPPGFLDAVVAVGVRESSGDPQWAASGFFYFVVQTRGESEIFGHVYLVSNRHVFEGLGEDAIVRVNPEANDQEPRDFDLKLKRVDGSSLWFGHPDADVDVAVVPINAAKLLDEHMQVRFIQSDRDVLRRGDMEAEGLCEGDGIYVLGFPMGMVAIGRSTAIVRSGCIARVRDLIAGTTKSFLVDATVFPGNSGGPLVLVPEITSITGTKHHDRALVLGVVSEYVAYTDVAVSSQTKRPRITFEENSGLARAHPIDHIEEAIQSHLDTIPSAPEPQEEPDTVSTAIA